MINYLSSQTASPKNQQATEKEPIIIKSPVGPRFPSVIVIQEAQAHGGIPNEESSVKGSRWPRGGGGELG